MSPNKTGRVSAWNRFWFTPADPTLLGLIRICCGAITFYTLFIYSFQLQEFIGEDSWLNLDTRLQLVHESPRDVDGPLNYPNTKIHQAKSREEADYNEDYRKRYGSYPPLPYPATKSARDFTHAYRETYLMDVRLNGIRPPETLREEAYVVDYTVKFKGPPPAYPDFDDPLAIAEIEQYIYEHRRDPRVVYARGTRSWSLWFDLTDPAGMAAVHAVVVLIAFLFTIGFCTRVTSALTWMCSMWYIHRSPVILFGVDTMQTIMLLYLMIGPSGAALSVDRLIARWWSQNKLRVINRWRALWRKSPLTADQIFPAVYSPTPVPSVSANVAYRLIQIHVCIIYLVAGLAKLMGAAWWRGTAVWGTLANYEFAPMQFEIYNWTLRQIAGVRWIFHIFLAVSGWFTLAFEISYAYLIWRPSTRWWILAGAIILHGFIGLFMGLKTFSLMMLVMNMAFLTNQETNWFLSYFRRGPQAPSGKPTSIERVPESALARSPALKEASTAVQRK